MTNNQKFGWIIFGTFLATLVGCKTLQETAEGKKFTQPEGVVLMTEAELRNTLVGNTYEGVHQVRWPGSTYIEYLHPDGKILGLWNGYNRYWGKWAISDKVFCSKYKSSSGCYTLTKSGNTIYWHDLNGKKIKNAQSNVMVGDPKNLSN